MRQVGWEERALAAIAAHATQGFVWGTSDCWCLAMDVVKAVTGTDPWAAARTYTTATGAARVLKKHGFASVADALAATFDEIPPAFAWRGDIGVVETDGALAAVVFDGAMVVGKTPVGLIRLSRSLVSRAFRVV